jgi:hypothetical protein
MTKPQVIWLSIRLAGVWFLWQSIENAVALLSTYLQVSQDRELLSRSSAILLQIVLLMGVHTALGIYCLGGGTLLFNLLNREKPDDGNSDSTESSSILGIR